MDLKKPLMSDAKDDFQLQVYMERPIEKDDNKEFDDCDTYS